MENQKFEWIPALGRLLQVNFASAAVRMEKLVEFVFALPVNEQVEAVLRILGAWAMPIDGYMPEDAETPKTTEAERKAALEIIKRMPREERFHWGPFAEGKPAREVAAFVLEKLEATGQTVGLAGQVVVMNTIFRDTSRFLPYTDPPANGAGSPEPSEALRAMAGSLDLFVELVSFYRNSKGNALEITDWLARTEMDATTRFAFLVWVLQQCSAFQPVNVTVEMHPVAASAPDMDPTDNIIGKLKKPVIN